jgi:hypothetical protein
VSTAIALPPELLADLKEPATTAEQDTAPLVCQFDGCTNGVTKPARGATPKFCPEHKGSRSRSTGGKSSVSNKSWPRAKEIETILNQTLGYATIPVAFFNVDDAAILGARGPKVIHELVELAKDDKNLQNALVMIATPGKYGPITAAVLGLVVPILANHKLIPAAGAAIFDILDGGE